MQIIHYLPTENQLILSPITAQSVVELLTVPFTSLDEAKEFWLEYPSTIVVLNSKDTPEIVLAMLDDLSRHFIEQAELTPEFVEALPEIRSNNSQVCDCGDIKTLPLFHFSLTALLFLFPHKHILPLSGGHTLTLTPSPAGM